VRALAAVLWLRGQSSARAKEAVSRQVYGPTGAQAADWWSQVQRELDSLEARAPGAMADVGETISDALDLVNALGAEIGIHVESRFVQPGLVAAAHPVLLQQVLISSMKRLAPHLVDGRIASYARLEDGKATITLAGAIGPAWELTETELIAGIPTSKDISIEARLDGAQLFVWIRTPSADRVTVLVVDDNEDMARFYRDCTLGTSYHVVHITQGRDLSQAIEAAAPDIVVLDVMLPDIDGWRLLMRLRQDSKTRSIPVVICSVVQEEDLARSLGAAAYLPKPVSPRDFVETLDQVLLRARAAALRDSARSA